MQALPNNGMRNQQFPGQTGQVSGSTSPPNQPQQHPPQNSNFTFNQNQMNPGANAPNPQLTGGLGGMNVTPQQRQLLMMQQQQQQHQQMRASGSGNPAMMNSEAYAMAQERSRQEQQQRMSQAHSPPNNSSPPMSSSFGNDAILFPALRSNSTIPGIARSTRSPSDGAPSPMSPQMSRGSSQDMRRMMNPNMGASMGGGMGQMPGFNQQMPNWQPKNQLGQQQQSIPIGNLQMPNFGVQPGAANSFASGLTSNQNWGVNQYPMASSPNSGGYLLEPSMPARQSSSTPAPQMQSHGSPPIPQILPNEFEMFSWGGQ
jgi:hypothetical protein